MSTIVITNLTTSPIYLADFYTTLGASPNVNTAVGPSSVLTLNSNTTGNSLNSGGNVQLNHYPMDVAKMIQIQQLIAAGSISVVVTPSAAELAAGLSAGADAVGTLALQEVVSSVTTSSVPFTIRVPLASGGSSGTADDTTVFAVGALPFAFRILDMVAMISSGVSGSIEVYSHAAAGGTALSGPCSTTSTGVARMTTLTATVQTPISGTDGVFVHRTDRSAVGELILTCRRESAGL